MAEQNKTVKELRAVLKDFMYKELENLSETLEDMEPKEKLDILIKLMPYAMPKNDTVSFSYGEPDEPVNWGSRTVKNF